MTGPRKTSGRLTVNGEEPVNVEQLTMNEEHEQEPAKASNPEIEGEGLWTVGMWSGLPLWQCRECAWNTLESEEAMAAHVLKHIEIVEEKPMISEIVVADRWGHEVSQVNKED